MKDLARKMHAAAAQAIVSDRPEVDARHAVGAALYELIQEYADRRQSVPLSDLRGLFQAIGEPDRT